MKETIDEIQKQINELEAKKKKLLSEYMKDNKLFINPKLDNILKVVCSFFDVTVDQLKNKRRLPKYVIARRFYCYLAREETKATLSDIGKMISRDHTTVLYSCKVVKDELSLYTDTQYQITELTLLIKK